MSPLSPNPPSAVDRHSDLLGVAGTLCVSAGLACIYWPAAIIFPGAVCIALAVLIARRPAPPSPAGKGKEA